MIFDVKPIVGLNPTDCGATCMQMLLAYYNIQEDLDILIKKCNTKITGCTMLDLKKCAELYNLDPHCYASDAEDVFTWDRPAIIWWKYSHFCIYCGIDEQTNKVIICNPDRGRYRISKGLFKALYSGKALTIGLLPESE